MNETFNGFIFGFVVLAITIASLPWILAIAYHGLKVYTAYAEMVLRLFGAS